MPDGQRKYTKELGRELHCSRKTRKRLLEQFDAYQHQMLDDQPSPTYEQMVASFGPPADFAATLMQEVHSAEQITYNRSRLILRIGAVALAMIYMVFSLYILYCKKVTVIEVKTDTHFSEEYAEPTGLEEAE